jgi:hypothetical protein
MSVPPSTFRTDLRPYLVRFAIVFVISLVLSAVFDEVAFLFQKENFDRAPQIIQLVIPAGTEKMVATGQNEPGIPAEMSFVIGDTLEVKNEDTVSHQLGPVWVPAGTSASLVLQQAHKLAYSCSFTVSRYLNIDVYPPTTLGTRLAALGVAGPTTAALFYLYSLLIFPVRSRKSHVVPVGTGTEAKIG